MMSLKKAKVTLDIEELSRRLDMPLYPTVARKRIGIDTLLKKAIELADQHIALHRAGIQGHTHEAACCNDPEHCTTVAEKELIRKIWTQTTEATRPVRAPNANTKMWNAIPISDKYSDGIYIKKHGRSHQSPQH